MAGGDSTIDPLVQSAAAGDREAMDRLLTRHRGRLKRMIAVRMSDQLQARVDPSDVVQEVLIEASTKLTEYARAPDAPFYVWLRQIAWQRLIDTTRRHVGAEARTVDREQRWIAPLPGQSSERLAERLMASGTSPSNQMSRTEQHEHVRSALERLPEGDREVLILRYLERLQPAEIADVLGISDRTVRARHRRALEQMLAILDNGDEGYTKKSM